MGPAVRALRGLPANPVLQRELRGFRRLAADWRLWAGLRLPRDARGWGAPPLVWFPILPYVVAGVVWLIEKQAPQYLRTPPGVSPVFVDALSVCYLVAGFYGALAAAALLATAITRERERESWETLRAAVSSPDELLLGLLAGRLTPALLAYLFAGGCWLATRRHYAPLLEPHFPFQLREVELALLIGQQMGLMLAAGALALAASAWAGSSGSAILAATALTIVLHAAAYGAAKLPPWPYGGWGAAGAWVTATAAGYALARRGVER